MKDKIYYFQEKSNDILDLQDEFSPEEIGIYFILKAAYFKYSGELREDNLCQRCKFFGDKNKLAAVSRKIFTTAEGLLINNSWLSEINDIKVRSEKRRLAANERWSNEDKKPKKTQSKPKITQSVIEKEIDYPAFINKTLLDDFFVFRHSIATSKKPFTQKAKELLIKKLSEFEIKQNGFANKALENSIENSWQGVFEPKLSATQTKPSQYSQPSYLDYLTGGKNGSI